jgi:hypothetical protein
MTRPAALPIQAMASINKFQFPWKAEAEDDIWAYRDKGNTLFRLGKYEEAISAFDTFCAQIPDETALFNKAVCLETLVGSRKPWSYTSAS